MDPNHIEQPTNLPTNQPTNQPANRPTNQPTEPTNQPTDQSTTQTNQPTDRPTDQTRPTNEPTGQRTRQQPNKQAHDETINQSHKNARAQDGAQHVGLAGHDPVGGPAGLRHVLQQRHHGRHGRRLHPARARDWGPEGRPAKGELAANGRVGTASDRVKCQEMR